MNKRELVAEVSANANISQIDARHAVDAMFDALKKALSKGQTVAIAGFGTFSVTRRDARVCRNPKTGEKISVPESRSPKFHPSKIFKDAVK